MNQDARPFDVTEEFVAQAHARVCAFDQTGNVGKHDLAFVHNGDTQVRHERCERIIGNLGARGGDGREKCGFPGIR